jgi:TP901 family phage tail tape measure protein
VANFEEIGVRATAEGVEQLIFQLGTMSKAILATGAAGASSAAGIGVMSAALGVVVVGAVAAVAALGAITAGLYSLGKAGVETAASVESAFAGVLKTTYGLGTNLFDLTEAGEMVFQEFRDMAKEIPLTFEELADIGQLVGQLGVAEDQIAGVTEIIAALGVSTNLSLKDAALVVSRFANVMSETGEASTEQFNRIGSSLVYLGNTYKATESEIVLTARNIAGAASLVGMSEADVLALGTAVIEAGVTSEAGGSAIQNTITTIQKAVIDGGDALELFAETAGLEADKFSELWGRDATEAFTLFIEGLTEQGADGIDTLDELDLAQRRSIRTLLGISKASVDLRGIMEDANMAFENDIYLAREAEIRYNTFDSQVQILKNNLRDLSLTIGMELLPILSDVIQNGVVPFIEKVSEGLQPIMEEIGNTIKEDVLPSLGDLAEALGIDTNVDSLAESVLRFGENINAYLENFSTFVDNLATFIDLVKTEGISEGLQSLGVSEETASSIEGIATNIGAISDAIKTMVEDRLPNFKQWSEDNIPVIVGLWQGLLDIIEDITGALAWIATKTEEATAKGILETKGETRAAIMEKTGIPEVTISDFLSIKGATREDAAALMREKSGGILEGISDWASGIADSIGESLSDAFSSLETTGKGGGGTLGFAGGIVSSLVQAFTGIFGQSAEELKPPTQTYATQVVGEIETDVIREWDIASYHIKVRFRDAGKDVIKGFVKGMESMMEWAIGKITAFGEKLAEAARDALQATSPSKVFAAIGEDVMLGFNEGVEKMTRGSQSMMTSNLGRVVGAGEKVMPSSTTTNSSVDRSFNTGDLVFNTRPENPASASLMLQRLALLQGG